MKYCITVCRGQTKKSFKLSSTEHPSGGRTEPTTAWMPAIAYASNKVNSTLNYVWVVPQGVGVLSMSEWMWKRFFATSSFSIFDFTIWSTVLTHDKSRTVRDLAFISLATLLIVRALGFFVRRECDEVLPEELRRDIVEIRP